MIKVNPFAVLLFLQNLALLILSPRVCGFKISFRLQEMCSTCDRVQDMRYRKARIPHEDRWWCSRFCGCEGNVPAMRATTLAT